LRTTRSGSIILEHDGGGDRAQTVAALKIVLPRLPDAGYQFRSPAPSRGDDGQPPVTALGRLPSESRDQPRMKWPASPRQGRVSPLRRIRLADGVGRRERAEPTSALLQRRASPHP
jgi:hypothetical protein